jgi:ABC-type transport system involved in multi-copper enzyme maturation permease subunit
VTAAPTEAAAARPADPAPRPRPAKPPLHRVAWVIWRQHRTALLLLTGALTFCALLLVYYGHQMHADFATLGLAGCYPGHPSKDCGEKIQQFAGDQNRASQLMAAFLPLPVLFGLFLGAPLLAREYESGTYRFAFTQDAGRTRWLVTKIVLLIGFTIVATTAFTLVVMWWYAPLVPLDGRLGATGIQEIYGAVFVGRAVFALALGIFAGALLRRVVPAIGATLVGWVAVVVLAIVSLRQHLMTPITLLNPAAPTTAAAVSAGDGDPSGWILSDIWRTPTGHVLNFGQVENLQYEASLAGHKLDFAAYMANKGYTHTVVYQPLSRFWDFQIIETAGLAVLATVLLAAAVWLVRRRAA